MSVASFVLGAVIAGVSFFTAVAVAVRWLFNTGFDKAMGRAMDPDDGIVGRQFSAAAAKLDSVDRAVNQTTGRTLTKRVDDLGRCQKELVASVDGLRGEVRDYRRESADDRAAIARRVSDLEDAATTPQGDRPPLTDEQARQIARAVARRRAELSGPDTETHT